MKPPAQENVSSGHHPLFGCGIRINRRNHPQNKSAGARASQKGCQNLGCHGLHHVLVLCDACVTAMKIFADTSEEGLAGFWVSWFLQRTMAPALRIPIKNWGI